MAANIVAPLASTVVDDIMDALVDKMVDVALEPRVEGGSSLADVLDAVDIGSTHHQDIARAVIRHEGTVEELWADLLLNTELTETDINNAKRGMQFGALTRYHAPLVEELHAEFTSLRKLAELDGEDWDDLVGHFGFPPDVPGADPEER